MSAVLDKMDRSWTLLQLSAGTTALALFSAAAAGGTLRWMRNRKALKEKEAEVDKGEKFETLLAVEHRMNALDMPPVTTLTWFEGDHIAAATYLEKRVREIVDANPWLGGRVKRSEGALVVTFQREEPLTFVHVRSGCNLSRSSSIADVNKSAGQFIVKNGHTEPVFKVAVIPCAEQPQKRFGMLASMSHVVADGHTFYSIHNMLSASQPVVALRPERNEEACTRMMQMLDEPKMLLAWYMQQTVGRLWRIFLSPLIGPTVVSRRGFVDNEWVQQAKAEAAKIGDVPYVSTNDVLTSWFFKATNVDSGVMAVNFRSRVPDLTEEHAGNYEKIVFYRRQDFERPSLIRLSLASASAKLKRFVSGGQPMTLWEMLTGTGSICTNWSTFARDNELPQCKEDVHIPIYDLSAWLPANACTCVIFRARRGQLGMLCNASPTMMRGTWEGGPLIEAAW